MALAAPTYPRPLGRGLIEVGFFLKFMFDAEDAQIGANCEGGASSKSASF